MTYADTAHDVRDPELPGRLLTAERDALIPLLRSRPDEDFALATLACPGWTVRDVLAHCSAALTRVVERRFEEGVFSPEANDRDIAERAAWTNAQVVDELERGMTEAGASIARAGGALDAVALGEWVHAGDVRDVLGVPGAYGGAGLGSALTLLGLVTRQKNHRPLHADLDDLDDPLRLGDLSGELTPARYIGDAPTLVRLYSGRPVPDGSAYELAGATPEELIIFG
ncbi:maleylpyruvate isomerase family mycothiol-dependent enzyme [Streptomyces prunicolor]|uniref:Maleylpyruvate isomerase family mycothiol-dependent enzyme n=1 Tax=Streptomyces prunicolor TaxID=67348 RepID=A0ABU4F1L6_9ACTN|nr:maleylpyruvate isomerase family mycothiol-dependent enzyme [Streptomyces prunicolor]MCX5235160.1 maleylpyruvate isomerase family mycothiol-dependent enzyme [Streptomyces prunicolor]MDV7214487.1 maleylpyruvate isomerase family mycothiol-dependent enzyme [Streptomyces prunicolor]